LVVTTNTEKYNIVLLEVLTGQIKNVHKIHEDTDSKKVQLRFPCILGQINQGG